MATCWARYWTLSPHRKIMLGLNGMPGPEFSCFLLCMSASSYSPVRKKPLLSTHHPSIDLSVCSRLILTLQMSQKQCVVKKPGCCNCCMSREMYSTEGLSYYIILWTDFSPLGGDLSLACHGCRIQSAAASGGLWQICRALGDNSWSCLSALHHSLWKSVKRMHMAFFSTDTSIGSGTA